MRRVRGPRGARVLNQILLDATDDLCARALEEALKRVETNPHDGWADLVVHQNMLRPALKLANAHNLTKPAVKLRVLADTKLDRDGWKLKTRSTELVVERRRA